MRGLLVGARRLLNLVGTLALVLLLANPALALGTLDLAPTAPLSRSALDPVADDAPLDVVVGAAKEHVRENGGTRVWAPDQYPHYAMLSDEEKRALWQIWVLAAEAEAARPFDRTHPVEDTTRGAAASAPLPKSTLTEPLAAQGLSGIWTVDIHGHPLEVIPGDGGAYFLATSKGIMRFEPGAERPTWMIKPGQLSGVETLDHDGDGLLDLVLTVSPWFAREGDPTFFIVDGVTGETRVSLFADDAAFTTWRLSDVDGDGAQEVLGLDVTGTLRAVELDGTELWQRHVAEWFGQGAGYFLAYAFVYYFGLLDATFADVDGDGALDFVRSDQLWAYASAFLVGESIDANAHVAFSGRDGAELWTAPLPGAGSFSYFYPVAAADLDGDGMEDVAYMTLTYNSAGAVLVSAYLYATGTIVTSGEDGLLLADDRNLMAGTILVRQTLRSPGYDGVIGFSDLDRDGATEMVAVATKWGHNGMTGIDVIGRGPGHVGMPTEELWRQSITLNRPLSDGDGSIRFRDANGDGLDELYVHLVAITLDKDGNVTGEGSESYVLDAEAVRGGPHPALLLDSDIDAATGVRYAWTAADRWTSIDAEGRPLGDGMRLLVSGYILGVHDADRDGTPDLALPKSSGLVWLDGENGRALREFDGPIHRYASQLAFDNGQPVLIERSYWTGDTYGIDARTGQQLWKINGRDMREDHPGFYPQSFGDFNGDGRLDVLGRTSDYSGDSVKQALHLFTLPAMNNVWTFAIPSRYPSIMFNDVLPGRPGLEILLRDSGWYDNTEAKLTLVVPGEDSERWTIKTPDASLMEAAEGYLVLRHYGQDTQRIEVLAAATGAINHTFAIPKDTYVSDANLAHVGGGSAIDLLLTTYRYEDNDEERLETTRSIDLGTGTALGSFILRQEARDGYWYSSPVMMTSDGIMFAYDFYSWSDFRGTTGDWDGDGLADLAYVEVDRFVLRSAKDGTPIAVSPMRTSSVFLQDLNGDGRSEVGILSAHGRLRFHAHDSGAVDVEMIEPLLLVAEPDQPVTEDERFFAEEQGFLPAAPALMVLLCLALLAGVARRRK